MKDPVSVLGCWRGFSLWLDGSTQGDSTYKRLKRLFYFFSRSSRPIFDRDARPRHHSRPQTGERPSRPPRLFRRRQVCTKLRDHLHQSSKPDTSAWCPPPFLKTTRGGMELEEGGHAGTEWNQRARGGRFLCPKKLFDLASNTRPKQQARARAFRCIAHSADWPTIVSGS